MTSFKICGLRDAAHARAAADAGAFLLGFVFVPGVRRQLTEAEGRRVIESFRKDSGEEAPRESSASSPISPR